MDIEIANKLAVPGYSEIEYKINKDHAIFTQSNYHYSDHTDAVVLGWYTPELMHLCERVVAIWRVKRKFNVAYSFCLN